MELFYWSMNDTDGTRLSRSGWAAFLDGKNPNYPNLALAFRPDANSSSLARRFAAAWPTRIS
ncbi:MAG: hypothetical protein ACLQVF_25675 [Isosphaeraceae bacterium]